MCGIVAYIGRPADPDLTRAMNRTMVHRGPDGEGYYHGPEVGLGMRRLAIIDKAGGDQPIFSEDGQVVVVYNGEIYNHLALRQELEGQGHRFRTKSDTEVLVHGYEQWGPQGLLNHLNGMFAFALYDVPRRQLLVARDRLGIKPLYYFRQGRALYLASEVKALARVPSLSLELNTQALGEYLALRYVPTPQTLFKGISKLPAGHYLLADESGGLEINRFWFPQADTTPLSDDDYLERFGELFNDAVRMRLMSEVPLGAYLSEGIDSTMVVWAMTKALERPVSTFCMGFGSRHDENAGAAEMAALLGTQHKQVFFREQHLGLLPRVLWHLEEPIGDAHIIPSYILAREAKRELTVVLLGEGADEFLYGYPFYKVAWLGRAVGRFLPGLVEKMAPEILLRLPLALLRRVFPLPGFLGEDGRRHMVHFLKTVPRQSGAEVFRSLTSLFSPQELRDLLVAPPPVSSGFAMSYFARDEDDRSPDGLLSQINSAQLSGWLQDNILLRHDKLAMAHSVECRVPFLDYRLVEFLAGVPRRLKVSGWRDKILSRRYCARNLGSQVAKRPKKPFFLPVELFFRSQSFQDMLKENLSPARLRQGGYFKPQAVGQMVHRAASGDFLAAKRVMSLIIFQLWHRIFIEGQSDLLRSDTDASVMPSGSPAETMAR